jgi:ketosteroid isomerase-like protein
MTPEEIVQAYLDAFNAGDLETAATYYADDFQFVGPTPEPLGPDAYLGISHILKAAFPDIDYDARVTGSEGDVVYADFTLSGTHEGDLDLRPVGMSVIPATGIHFSNPTEHSVITVRDGQLVSLRTEPRPDAGLPGILSQLGVQMP